MRFYDVSIKRKPILHLRVILPLHFKGQTSASVLLNNYNVSCVCFIDALKIKFNSMPCYIAIVGQTKAHCDWIPRGA